MNRITITCFAVAGALTTALPAFAAPWAVVSKHGSSETLSVDAASVDIQGKLRSYWWEIKLPQPTLEKNVIIGGYRIFSVVNCIEGTYQAQKVQAITPHNTVGFTVQQGTNSAVRVATPGSNAEIAMRAVCAL
ncbi:MAG: hypothetical protein KME08_01505 [Aphanothece sp. CMT-3BRIN-NPC111]|jgi:hypothetical protein|nr:hypothetical protein [Aphanothece sp. CMT-3BRIN-NPC111]